jgi:hypothetical protein
MTETNDHDRELEARLAEALEDYHRRRALGEPVSVDDYADRLGEDLGAFREIVDAESMLDELVDPPVEEPLPRPFGAYTLLREVGRGSMGVVYEAVHRELGRTVALKVLRPGYDVEPVALERFRREARACAQVRHPCIVDIYEAGRAEDRFYYAMPLLEGKSLAQLIRAGEFPEAKALAEGLAGVADALDALHRVGIVHRDVKPGNIMVLEDGRMVLADFGLARTAAADTLTRSGQALGTPLYMSPEQLLGDQREIDGRTDVYGVGATLYEVLTGRPPFRADDLPSLMRMIVAERPRPLTEIEPEAPRDLARVAMSALEKRKEDRYASAAKLAEDLRAAAQGRPVVGRPVSDLRLGLRRMKRFALPAAAAALLVVVGLVWSGRRPATLTVECNVAAEVLVDRRAEGPTPRTLTLPPGEHEVEIVLPGFHDPQGRMVVRLEPGEKRSHRVVLVADDPDDLDALAALSPQLAWSRPPASEVRERGLPMADPGPRPLLPRGDVRIEDLAVLTLDTDGPGGKAILRRRGEVLLEVDVQPGQGTIPVPEEVREKLQAGDEATWGVRTADGRAAFARFRVVAKDLRKDLAALGRQLEGQSERVRDHLRARLLLAHGLPAAAWHEAARTLADDPASAPALRTQLEALDALGLDGTAREATIRAALR